MSGTLRGNACPAASPSAYCISAGTHTRAYSENEYLDREMHSAVTYFNENYNQDISIENYAQTRGMSVSWFIRNFKKYTGMTPMQFIVSLRVNNAQILLEQTNYSIYEIAKIVGYDDQLYFSRLFRKQKGVSPSQYRKRQPLA